MENLSPELMSGFSENKFHSFLQKRWQLQIEQLESLSSDFFSSIDADQFAYLSDEVIGQIDAEMISTFARDGNAGSSDDLLSLSTEAALVSVPIRLLISQIAKSALASHDSWTL